MVKIQFMNAQVNDDGFGLKVNGTELAEIISTALGTRVGNTYGYNSGLPPFVHNCCNITVVIEPQPVCMEIVTNDEVWYSVKDMEEDMREQYNKEIKKE